MIIITFFGASSPMAAAFKNSKWHLILFLLLIFHCSFLYPGTALSPDENMPAGSFLSGSGGNENMPVLSSPPISTPATATNKNSQLGPSLNNQGLQSPVVYQQQQGLMNNYPQQSINQNQNQKQNQLLSGFIQPFSSLNQPFLGVNNQPFGGVGNQQGLVDNNTPFESGASQEKRLITGLAALISLITMIVTLGFVV